MSESKLPRPTDGELAILRVLWERGTSTVREVHEALNRREPEEGTGYTTVLKLMQIMTEKGLVERDESQRAHVYRAKATEQRTQRQLVSDLMERAFGGSPARLAMQALSSRKTSPQELAELRQLLDSLEGADE
ncbi:BlaI/MecI/CopY family transcriptional regulator [Myxococcus sp. K15C18031901]|uniref:BlaI/MecI/CopY family transcriptional regulator n=1 Tax=Myxococcus dinghuensis TaxID=2906761 RepID=UPI0020A802CB|nr:BlaI/MecI/CopY family transcriptional regulator [Myxococcus dinghuensis]MCP3099235.1 BlaI/MecI/CopY family transcriptional regulator [Myxococcus dinghuensis]